MDCKARFLNILDFWILLILDFAKFCFLIWLFCDLAVLSLFVVLIVGLKHLEQRLWQQQKCLNCSIIFLNRFWALCSFDTNDLQNLQNSAKTRKRHYLCVVFYDSMGSRALEISI